MQSLKKRLKLIQHLESKIGPFVLLFLQETHSNSKVEIKWKEKFLYFLTEKQILAVS